MQCHDQHERMARMGHPFPDTCLAIGMIDDLKLLERDKDAPMSIGGLGEKIKVGVTSTLPSFLPYLLLYSLWLGYHITKLVAYYQMQINSSAKYFSFLFLFFFFCVCVCFENHMQNTTKIKVLFHVLYYHNDGLNL